MRSVLRSIVFVCLSCFFVQQSFAQCDPILLPDSNQFIFTGFENEVKDVYTYGNATYVGGSFEYAGKYTGGCIGLDLNIGKPLGVNQWPKANGDVWAVIADGAGGIYIGGAFTHVGTIPRNGVAHIDVNNQVTSLDPNVNGVVNSLAMAGNTLYIGGNFTTVGGQTRNKLATVDATTGNVTTWNPNVSGGYNNNGTIYSIIPDGQNIYIGGDFNQVGGFTRNALAAVNATTGAATTWNPNVNTGGNSAGTVYDIEIDGNLVYIGGNFYQVGIGNQRLYLAAIDKSNGWPTNLNSGVVTNTTVNCLLKDGSRMYAGGSFTTILGVPRQGFAEIDLTTGLPTSTVLSLTGYDQINTEPDVSAIAKNGNDLYLAGTFSWTGQSQQRMVKVDATNYAIAPNWNCLTDNYVWGLLADGNKLYTSGTFAGAGVSRRNGIAAIDHIGDSITVFDPLVDIGIFSSTTGITAIAADANSVYFSGDLTQVNGVQRMYIAATDLNGTLIPTWNPGVQSNNTPVVNDMKLHGSTLYFCGDFDATGGQGRDGLAAMDAATAVVTSWNPTINSFSPVFNDMLIIGDTMFLSGQFNSLQMQARSNLAAVRLSTGNLTNWNPSANGETNAISNLGNTIYAGGNFSTIGSQSRYQLGAVLTGTGAVQSWSPNAGGGGGYVYSIAAEGNTIYAAGDFTELNYLGTNPVLRTGLAGIDINGTPTAWSPSIANNIYVDPVVSKLHISGDKLFVGGRFESINTTSRAGRNLAIFRIQDVAPNVTISGNSAICLGASATYSATTNVTGATYQWQVNGSNVGTNSNTYTYTPANNDQVTCIINATGTCYSSTTDTSNVITINAASITPTISIAGSSTVCIGSNSTYTATTNITGGTYQWQVNGSNVGTNTSTYSYTPANSDQVSCIITVPGTGCYTANTATSNIINITTTNSITPDATISSTDTTICSGTQVTFTATTTNITNGTYQWQVNSGNVGTNSNTYTYIPGNNDQVLCVITVPSGSCYTASTATSNTITMIVDNIVAPTISISAPSTAVLGSTVNVTAVVTNAGTNYNIEWKNNGTTFDNTTVPSTSYTKAPGQDNITAIISPAGCYSVETSNTAIVNETLSVGQVSAEDNIKVYPNPFVDEIMITSLKKGDNIAMYDIMGRKMQEWHIDKTQNQSIIKVADISPGIYILRINDEKGALKRKISLQRK